MNRELLLKVMQSVGIFVSLILAMQFVFFIDQFPMQEAVWSLSIKEVSFLDASVIKNGSYFWMIFLIAYNVLTLGLGLFFVKPNNKKLIELSVYNVALSVMFFLSLILYVNMFPEFITGQITHGIFKSTFFYEGVEGSATNLIYILTLVYLVVNVVFLNLKDEK